MKQVLYILIFGVVFIQCKQSKQNGSTSDKEIYADKKKTDYTKEILEPEKYAAWVKDKQYGLRKEKEITDIVYSVQYKPVDFLIIQETRGKALSAAEMDEKRQDYAGTEFYELRIALKEQSGELLKYDLSSPQQYQERVQYMAFDMQKDIKMVLNGTDTIPCAMYHFERAYDVTPFASIQLGFNLTKEDQEKEHTLVINDKLFNKGLIKFTYQPIDYKNIPKIKGL